MQILLENTGLITKGLVMTLWLAVFTLFLSTVVSLILGVMATFKSRILRWTIHAYVEFFRAIPLIVNIFFVYFVLPMMGVNMTPLTAVVFGLTLWGSANGIEIVRAGIESVPPHQWRSAWALGLRPWEVYWYVIWPQAIRSIVPSFTGLLTLLVQATSLGALVGVTEFLKVGQIIIEHEAVMRGISPAFFVYGFVLLVYFVICSSLSWCSRYLEKRMAAGRTSKTAKISNVMRESI